MGLRRTRCVLCSSPLPSLWSSPLPASQLTNFSLCSHPLQIISYLSSRAHPQMKALATTTNPSSRSSAENPLLPTTVVDQIRLWEHERRRIVTAECYLYDEFSSEHDFELVREYAREVGGLLWEDGKRRRLGVSAEGQGQVRCVSVSFRSLSSLSFPLFVED